MKTRTRQLILWLSIGLNFALVSAIVLTAFAPQVGASVFSTNGKDVKKERGHRDSRRSGGSPFRLEKFFFGENGDSLNLTDEQKEQIQAELTGLRNNSKECFGQMRELRMEMINALIENPDDNTALDELEKKNDELARAISESFNEALREVARALTPDQRSVLRQALEEDRAKWEKRKEEASAEKSTAENDTPPQSPE